MSINMNIKTEIGEKAGEAMAHDLSNPAFKAVSDEIKRVVAPAVNTAKLITLISVACQTTAQVAIATERGIDPQDLVLTPEEQEDHIQRLRNTPMAHPTEGIALEMLLAALLGDGHIPGCDCDKGETSADGGEQQQAKQ